MRDKHSTLREVAARAFAGEPVVFGYLFGSEATGKTHPRSDVDVAVYLEASVPRDRYLDYRLSCRPCSSKPASAMSRFSSSTRRPFRSEGESSATERSFTLATTRPGFSTRARPSESSSTLRPLRVRLTRSSFATSPPVVADGRPGCRALLDRLANEIDQLRALGRAEAEELLTDRIRLDAAKYVMVIAVEICIDIGQHIIASEGLRAPEDFADVFSSLAEGGIIPKEMDPSLKEMARFRNLLVHVYERVDDRRVVEILQSRLGDFGAFREQIAAAVTSKVTRRIRGPLSELPRPCTVPMFDVIGDPLSAAR
jgi:uncharacterized protein YutE (UPF0331/DUF86 family)